MKWLSIWQIACLILVTLPTLYFACTAGIPKINTADIPDIIGDTDKMAGSREAGAAIDFLKVLHGQTFANHRAADGVRDGVRRKRRLHASGDSEIGFMEKESGEMYFLGNFTPREINILTTHNASGAIIPLTKSTTVSAISMIEILESLGAAGSPSTKRGEFMAMSAALFTKLTARSDDASLVKLLDKEVEAIASEDWNAERPYTADEIDIIRMQRDSIADVQGWEMRFARKINRRISQMGGNARNCRDLVSNLENTKAVDGNSASMETNDEISPEDILALDCTNRVMVASLDKLIGCMEAEIIKGAEETPSEADFCTIAFTQMRFVARMVSGLNGIIAERIIRGPTYSVAAN